MPACGAQLEACEGDLGDLLSALSTGTLTQYPGGVVGAVGGSSAISAASAGCPRP